MKLKGIYEGCIVTVETLDYGTLLPIEREGIVEKITYEYNNKLMMSVIKEITFKALIKTAIFDKKLDVVFSTTPDNITGVYPEKDYPEYYI